MRLAAFLPLAVLPFALATTHTVKVGVDKSDKPALVYTPDNLKPAKDDTIVFQFYSDDHSVAQSTFDKPCEYVDGGIFSSFPGPVRFQLRRERVLPLPRRVQRLIRGQCIGQDVYHHHQ